MHHIRRALISVSDKTGLVPLAQALAERGIEIISTGGTAKVLREAGIAVVELSEYTGFPEMFGGRVKTLHPKVHGGLLHVRGDEEHERQAVEHGIGPIDLVVVNLYPFEKTVAAGAHDAEVIEQIDIGGPSMIRSAAKNHASVAVVVDPAEYEEVAQEIRAAGGLTLERRRQLAGKAFARTAQYDAAIAGYFAREAGDMPPTLTLAASLAQPLRYGENPHQRAALYGNFFEYYTQLQGKELSYNNILDLTAAAELAAEFVGEDPAVVILKHMNPCGVGQGKTLREAWEKAYATDRQAPFGGIIASNVQLDGETASAIKEIFCEVIVAPSFSEEARTILAEKKNLRLIEVMKDLRTADPLRQLADGGWRVRSVGAGSYLLQEADAATLDESTMKVVTKRAPTEEEMAALRFAWRVVKHVKSNAIVYALPDRTLGIGAGQMSRVDSSRIAAWKAQAAGFDLTGSAMASDAFFPFPDALIAAADAGATAIIQPGGSIRDAEVIAAADERNIAMVFTGMRHFRH